MKTGRFRSLVVGCAALLLVATMTAACGSPPHAASPATATASAPSAPSAPAATPTPFPVITAKVVGSTAPDEITALAASSDRVWLAVDDAILESADSGAHWRQASTISGGAESLSFTSAKDGWAGTTTGLLHTTDGGTTWAPVPSAGSDVTRVRFVDAAHGWVGGKSVFERTTDGGRTWQRRSEPCDGRFGGPFFSFVDAEHGWLLCAGEPSSGSQGRALFRTNNGGEAWALFSEAPFGYANGTTTPYSLPGTGYANDLFFLDAMHGWIGGERQAPESTSDGAHTWTYGPKPASEDEAISDDVIFTSPLRGYTDARDAGMLFATADGGATWSIAYALPQLAPPPPASTIASVSIGDRTVAWSTLLPGYEVWAQAMHGGDLWVAAEPCREETLPPDKGDPQHRTYENCGRLLLLRSDDEGRSWTQYTLPGIDPQDVFVAAAGTLRIGEGGPVFEASDDGRTWTRVAPVLLPSAPPATVEPGP